MSSFPATFGTRDHAGHAEPLRMTEVPYQIGQTAICREFSTPPEPACDSTCEPLLDQEGLAYLQKPPFCRYLSPLPDSNRGPPPYHGRSPRQRFWLVWAVCQAVGFATGCHRLQPRGSI